MSKHDTQPIREPADCSASDQSTANRVDAAHLPEQQASPSDAVADEQTAQQLRRQASQLASSLRASQKEIDHRWSYLNAQTAQLDRDARAARLWLNERTVEVDQTQRLHRQLAETRSEVQREGRLQRQRMAAQQRRAQAELEKERKAVERRADQVDRDRATLEKLRGKLSKMHHETLEIRLATEELWERLSGVVPPDVLTRLLERIRSKLSEQYRIAGAELDEQKDELQTIRRQMTEQHKNLLDQKRQLEQWATKRQKQIDHQTARLIAREDQLRSREAEPAVC